MDGQGGRENWIKSIFRFFLLLLFIVSIVSMGANSKEDIEETFEFLKRSVPVLAIGVVCVLLLTYCVRFFYWVIEIW